MTTHDYIDYRLKIKIAMAELEIEQFRAQIPIENLRALRLIQMKINGNLGFNDVIYHSTKFIAFITYGKSLVKWLTLIKLNESEEFEPGGFVSGKLKPLIKSKPNWKRSYHIALFIIFGTIGLATAMLIYFKN